MEEPSHDGVWRRAAVHKEQVVMIKPSVCETVSLVDLLIQTQYRGHVVFTEIWEVGLWCVERVTWRRPEDNKVQSEGFTSTH